MSDIVKPPVVEIIPAADLKGLRESLADLRKEAESLPAFLPYAQQVNVNDADQFRDVSAERKRLRKIVGMGEEKLRPYLNRLKEATDFVRDALKAHEAGGVEADKLLSDKLADYNRREREAAEREERRRNEEIRQRNAEEADRKRKADELAATEKRKETVAKIREALKKGEINKRTAEKMLREAGATEEADKARAAADAEDIKNNPPVETVMPRKVAVSGQRNRRLYFATVQDANLLLAAYVETFTSPRPGFMERRAYLRRFIALDEQELGKEARDVQNSAKLNAAIPGVLFQDKDAV